MKLFFQLRQLAGAATLLATASLVSLPAPAYSKEKDKGKEQSKGRNKGAAKASKKHDEPKRMASSNKAQKNDDKPGRSGYRSQTKAIEEARSKAERTISQSRPKPQAPAPPSSPFKKSDAPEKRQIQADNHSREHNHQNEVSRSRDHDHDHDHRHDHNDRDRSVYLSYPRSSFTLSFGNGYAGPGYYYGPSNSTYYYERPDVRYYSTREAAPREYYIDDGYTNGYNRTEAIAVQRELSRLGYYYGTIDGDIGPVSSRAIAEYQDDNGLRPTGEIDSLLLRTMGIN